jgi:hypothetical protein
LTSQEGKLKSDDDFVEHPRCPDHPGLMETANDMRWIKRLGAATFTLVLTVLVLVTVSIFNTGYQVRAIEQNAKDIVEIKLAQKELEKDFHLLQEEVRYGKHRNQALTP